MKVSRFGLFLVSAVMRLAIEVAGNDDSFLTSYSSSQKKALVAIQHIHVFGESLYMKVRAYIHDDRHHFDLNVRMVRELGSNHLIMNIKVRVRPEGGTKFVQLFEMRRINFCGFLSEYNSSPMLRFLFKKNIILSDVIECPIRVGNYSMMNSNVAENIQPDGVQNGTYKFFAEIVEENGEIAKVFALQVTTLVYIVEKDDEEKSEDE
ncbi:hypothetical protein KR032_010831 [Drosophila birchii]|nr:hypothetical protein KR032_010831 [Drosophila birchii]